LIAILVGFFVGKAVSWGSYRRGGWKYQTLAMVLTYLSIVASYVPVIVKEIAKNSGRTASAQSRGVQPGTQSPGDTSSAGVAQVTSSSERPATGPPRQ